jgi:cysteine-rich repeat protein
MLGGDADATVPCLTDRTCRDETVCNGEEWCDPDGVCQPGAPPVDGTDCPAAPGPGFCRAGTCLPGTCGNGRVDDGEECDDGNNGYNDGCDGLCRLECHAATECDDGNPCTIDDCLPTGGGAHCQSSLLGDGLACDDDDPCTTGDRCLAASCIGSSRDVECDDGNPCSGDHCLADPAAAAGWACEHARLPDWYPDADGDGWGVEGATVCGATAPAGYGAPGDCCDTNADVHPEQTAFFELPHTCAPDGTPSWDFDCDGIETPEWPDVAAPCPTGPRDEPSCPAGSGWCSAASGVAGCIGAPACGASGVYQAECAPTYDCWGAAKRRDRRRPDAGTAPAIEPARDGGADWSSLYESPPMRVCCRAVLADRTQRCR